MHELASNKHVTRRQLWREYRSRQADGLQYSAFCEHLRRWRKSAGADVVLTLEHKPGDKIFVDYSGDPIYYTDRKTGEQIAAQLFVAAWASVIKSTPVPPPARTPKTGSMLTSRLCASTPVAPMPSSRTTPRRPSSRPAITIQRKIANMPALPSTTISRSFLHANSAHGIRQKSKMACSSLNEGSWANCATRCSSRSPRPMPLSPRSSGRSTPTRSKSATARATVSSRSTNGRPHGLCRSGTTSTPPGARRWCIRTTMFRPTRAFVLRPLHAGGSKRVGTPGCAHRRDLPARQMRCRASARRAAVATPHDPGASPARAPRVP